MSELEAWARQAGPSKVLAAARDRIERGIANSTLRIDLNADERWHVGQLLGLDWERSSKPVTLKLLRDALANYSITLPELLERLGGPLVDRPALRAAATQSRLDERAAALAVLAQVVPAELLEPVAAACLPQREPLARAERLALVASKLPVEAFLPVLAAECFGESHALDRNTSLGRASARMAALLGGLPTPTGGMTAQEWRDAWAAVGVSCDRVSTMVLTLNLPLGGRSALHAISGLIGEPVWLTARLLDGAQPLDPLPQKVFVCENPSVLETAADRLGARCLPLICTFGLPSQAALTLVRLLDQAGVRLLVRADNDRAGRQIVAALQAAAPGSDLWRFEGDSPTYEEQLIADLLSDLATPTPSFPTTR